MTYGVFVDEKTEIPFVFDGAQRAALLGDSLSSALWRGGVRVLSRSFKYHRRRGILSLCGEDANTLFDIDGCPNVNGDMAQVFANMSVVSRHHWGGLENDRLAALGALADFLPPGFYYRAFYQPRGAWRRWEPLIRRLAGLGVVDSASPAATPDKQHAHCDVAVVGGGAAGLAAAAAAAKAGKQVALLDKNPLLGGAANWLPPAAGAPPLAEQIAALPPQQVTVYNNCRVTGVFADGWLLAALQHNAPGKACMLRLRARQVVVATGERDAPCVFANNDLPGVMLTQAALRLAFLYDVAAGKRAVLLAAGEACATAARALRQYGINIAAVAVLPQGKGGGGDMPPWARDLQKDGFVVLFPVASVAARGKAAVESVTLLADGKKQQIYCDCLLMSAGKTARQELAAMAAGCGGGVAPVLAGAAAGHGGAAAAATHGAAAFAGKAAAPRRAPLVAAAALVPQKNAGMVFVDFEEDLQAKDIAAAIYDGFADPQLLKRYTTAGMGPAQGKLGNAIVGDYIKELTAAKGGGRGGNKGKGEGEGGGDAVILSTPRPPAGAETLAQLAGGVWHPVKHGALRAAHRHLSARFMVAGEWLRPAVYSSPEEEATQLRSAVGMIDVSTLGKIELRGKNAAELLERLYTGAFAKQKVGATRYALLLDETGVIADDGVAARLAENVFWLTTSTGNAAAVYRNLLLWNARWNLGVAVVNLTDGYGAINVAGPRAVDALRERFADVDWSLPYMQCARVDLAGAPALIMRVGFVGEKGFEIHLPAGYLPDLWERLASGKNAAAPCGVEAQRLLRLEKGHIIVGQDTDGLCYPAEANMQWAVANNKEFFVGKRALQARAKRPLQRQLTGFVMSREWRDKVNESDLLMKNGEYGGRVTSIAYSPALRAVVGLAFAPPNAGGELFIRAANGIVLSAKRAQTPFYDPTGARQK